MIISPGRRYIFVHIPKTGGTSLALALETRAMKDDILIGDTPKARRRKGRLKEVETRGRLWKHATLADIEGLVPRGDLDRYFLFALVRNPWDRVVSYYHWLRVQDFAHPAVDLAKSADFSGFLNHPQTRASLAAEHYGSYLTDSEGVERPATFVRLEHIARDLAPVEAHLGFAVTNIPHVNRSDRPADYRDAYSKADAELVSRLCARDITRFGYAF